jgi:hypothetical protein
MGKIVFNKEEASPIGINMAAIQLLFESRLKEMTLNLNIGRII